MNRRVWKVVGLAAVLAPIAWMRLGPLPADLLGTGEERSTLVLDRRGAVLYEARSNQGARSVTMRGDAIPDTLLRATLAAEDRRFWWHPGVDPIAIVRAAWKNVRSGRVVEGGSTITQQVAKLLLARTRGSRQGWRAKAEEALVALRLEHRLSKREVIALYLSEAPYGNQINGAERASRAYFDRMASALTPAQAAFIAALPQRPSSFNPWRDADKARPRQREILRRMRDHGELSADEFARATAERIEPRRPDVEAPAPHFVERVLALAGSGSRPERVQTTLDLELQRTVRGIIDARREELDEHGARHAAVVVLDNRSGEWLAWEGSGDYFDPQGGAIDGVVAPRQPGSALKPFTYAVAFDAGFDPATVLPDVPTHFPTADPGVFYSPRNYDGLYRGPLLARAALAGSENVPAVAVLSRVGVPALLRFLRRAGITTLEKSAPFYGLGLTLGNAEVRLDELVAAYASLARGGVAIHPRALMAPAAHPNGDDRLLSQRAAYWVGDILADADAREYVFGRGGSLEFPFPVAAKTGTSQGFHDNWAIGFTREVTVGVWVGNFDRTPLKHSSGVTGAGPIFHAVMLAAMQRIAPASAVPAGGAAFDLVAAPPDVERHNICLLSGLAANRWCPRQGFESLPRGRERVPCSWHHESEEGLLTIWPPEYRHWAAERGLLRASMAPPQSRTATLPKRVVAARAQTLAIVNPPAGAIYLLDPTLRKAFQTLPLRATGASGEVRWTVNGRAIGRTRAEEPIDWPLAAGTHEIEVRDTRGRHARATVTIK